MMWLVLFLLGLIVLAAVFVLGLVLGVVLETWQIKENAPDIFRKYQERMLLKEEWQDGKNNGSA